MPRLGQCSLRSGPVWERPDSGAAARLGKWRPQARVAALRAPAAARGASLTTTRIQCRHPAEPTSPVDRVNTIELSYSSYAEELLQSRACNSVLITLNPSKRNFLSPASILLKHSPSLPLTPPALSF
jgi:hypothetical protein